MSTDGPRRPRGATRRRKVIGRGAGSGNGATAGRGTKGQNARSGGGVRPGFEGGQMPLFRRIARRGFSNVRFRGTSAALGLDVLEATFSDGEVVDDAALVGRGLVADGIDTVKILANGSLTRKLEVRLVKVSAAARAAIEAAGGSVSAATSVPAAKPMGAAPRPPRATDADTPVTKETSDGAVAEDEGPATPATEEPDGE